MIGIVIIFYNNPEFLLRQYATLKATCKEKYDLLVVDNSTDKKTIEAIKYHSQRLGLNYTKTNASSANGSDSHAFAANLALQKFRPHYSTLFFLDHDCFAIKPFKPSEILGDKYLMAGLGQQNDKYYWPGCFMVNCNVVVDFSPRPGMDTGGGTHKTIAEFKEQCLFFDETYQQNPHFTKSKYDFYALLNGGMFMHFINGSNWNNTADNEERLNSLYNILENYFSKN